MSGGDDGVICMWDLRQKQFTSKVLSPTRNRRAINYCLFLGKNRAYGDQFIGFQQSQFKSRCSR
jgi:hypothetical protein